MYIVLCMWQIFKELIVLYLSLMYVIALCADQDCYDILWGNILSHYVDKELTKKTLLHFC